MKGHLMISSINIQTIIGIHDFATRFNEIWSKEIRDHATLDYLVYRLNEMGDRKANFIDITSFAVEYIIKNHPFWDGNHRTAYMLGYSILSFFGYTIKPIPSEIKTFYKSIDMKNIPLNIIKDWLRENTIKRNYANNFNTSACSLDNSSTLSKNSFRSFSLSSSVNSLGFFGYIKDNKGDTSLNIFPKKNPINPIFLNINPKLSIETLVKKIGKGGNVAIVSGARGSGKTAASWYLVERMHNDLDKKIYVIGVPVSLSKHLPKYVNIVSKIEDVPNDCVVFIDEAGIQFASRMWRKDPHIFLSDMFHIARHKNISLVFVSLSSALVDVNIIRLADTLIFKRPSLLQFRLERRQIRNLYEKVLESFKKTKKPLRLTYIFDSDFEGTVELPLPSFWCEEISKSYKYFTIGKGMEGLSEIEEGTIGYIDSITYHCSGHGDIGLCIRNGGDYYNHEFQSNKPMLKRISDKFHIVGRVRVTGSGIEDYDGEENNYRIVDIPKEIKKIGILKEITVNGESLVVNEGLLATDKEGKWLFIIEEGDKSG